jgi:hypothetical protein
MIPIPSGVRAWIATGHTDIRRGMQGLALTVQESLKRDPPARDARALAQGWLSLLLALEIASTGRAPQIETERDPADERRKSAFGDAPLKGGAFQWVQVPPGNRSSRKQPEQSWR